MSQTITIRVTPGEVRRVMEGLVAALTGKAPDPSGLIEGIQLRMGMVLLSRIQADFIAKARGGTGSDGIQWAPLKKETIAQRPVSGAERKQLGIGGKRERGLLTPAENTRWKKIFASRLGLLMGKYGMDEGAAKARAAQLAWATLKAEGAKTKLEVLGNRTVEIGRSSGRLLNSLSVGVGGSDQVLRAEPGAVTVGTNVEYAAPFHAKRPLWRTDGLLPRQVATAVAQACRDGLAEAAVALLRGAA